MKHNFKQLFLFVGLGLTSGIAAAAPCDLVLSSYQTSYPLAVSGNLLAIANLQDSVSRSPECFGGSPATAQVQINGTSFQQVSAISSALGLRFNSDNPGPTAAFAGKGMAAGNAGKKLNIWGSADNNVTNQSYLALNKFTTVNDSSVLNTIFGADYSLSPVLVVGVSFAVDQGRTGGLNLSPGDVKKSIDTNGFTVAPYIGYQISKVLFFDGSIGLGKGDMKSNFATEGSSDRWFGAANLGYEHWAGNFQLSGKVGYLRGVEDYANLNILTAAGPAAQAGTSAKNTLGQVRVTAQAAYWLNGFMPYAALGYINDVERKTTQFAATTDPFGKNAWVWTLGANFISLSSGITGGLAYKREEGRSSQQNHAILANLAFRF